MLRLIALSLILSPALSAAELKVDTKASKVEWVGSKVTGSHNGHVPVQSGKLDWDNKNLKGGNIVINVAQLTNSDLSGEYQTKLINHLKSDDFFSTAKFPTAKLDVKSAKKLSGNTYEVNGDLTIKGITKPISFKADIEETNKTLNAKGKLTFDRTEYEVRYNSGKFFQSLGDNLIYDEIVLNFDLVANK